MARRRSVLSSLTSRLELPPSDAPEWEIVSPGVRLGYRRGRGTQARGGSWLAAARSVEGQRVQTKLGGADDVQGVGRPGIVTYDHAKDAARAWAKSLRSRGDAASPALTANEVLDRYFEARSAEGMKSA